MHPLCPFSHESVPPWRAPDPLYGPDGPSVPIEMSNPPNVGAYIGPLYHTAAGEHIAATIDPNRQPEHLPDSQPLYHDED